MSKNLFLVHAGGSKTGSTAIQNFCELNAERLYRCGIAYENRLGIASTYQMGSGNGYALYEAVIARQSEDLAALMQRYMGTSTRCICSSEYFAHFSADDWACLQQVLVHLDYDIRVLFYIRDVVPFLQSAYDQGIKRHGVSASFEDWSAAAEWEHAKAVKVIAGVIDASCFCVVHYDEVKHCLIRNFLDVVGVDSTFEVDGEFQSRIVNRSLTAFERQALLRINRSTGDRFSAELSDYLIHQRPEWKETPAICSPGTIELLRARFEPDVRWINQTFFNSRDQLAVLAGSMQPAIAPDPNGTNDFEDEKNCQTQITDWCLGKLQAGQGDAIEFVAQRLRNIDWKNAADAAIPADFDPVAYLLFNTDVLTAGVPPFEHYILAGQKEGRNYRWPA